MSNVCYIKRSYVDVLKDNQRENSTKINWTVLDNHLMVEKLGYDCNEMENFADMMTVENGKMKNEIWFENFFNFLFNHNFPNCTKANEKYTKHKLLNDSATIIFTTIGNDNHKALEKLLNRVVGGYKVVVLDGDNTSNEAAEELARTAVKDCKNNVIFISSTMANRSFSVPEIKNVILMMDGAGEASVVQKIARGLTPWDKLDTCNIIDVRLSYNQSCLATYLEQLAIDTLGDHATQSSTELLNYLKSTDKLVFNQYFGEGIDPLRRLTEEEIGQMMWSKEFEKENSLRIIAKELPKIKAPKRCGLDEELIVSGLTCKNVKGDSVKKIKVSANINYKAADTAEVKAKEELDAKKQHLAFLLNNAEVFNSYNYTNDILPQEFANMTSERKAAYEEMFDVDIDTITDIVKILEDNDVDMDKFFK